MKIYGLNYFKEKNQIPFYCFYIKDNNNDISKIYVYEDGDTFAIDGYEEYTINGLPEIPLYELSFNENFMDLLKKSNINAFKSNDKKAKETFIKLKETLLNQ